MKNTSYLSGCAVTLDAEIEFIKSIISELNRPMYLTGYEYDEELVKAALEKLANHWQTLEETKAIIYLEIGERRANAERYSE